jgi:ATP-dependent helicase YprA (DUF1998 family)
MRSTKAIPTPRPDIFLHVPNHPRYWETNFPSPPLGYRKCTARPLRRPALLVQSGLVATKLVRAGIKALCFIRLHSLALKHHVNRLTHGAISVPQRNRMLKIQFPFGDPDDAYFKQR